MARHDDDILEEGVPTPQFLNAEEEGLFAEVMLGDEAVRFLDSDLGRVLRGYAEVEKEHAKEALLTADAETPEGRTEIRQAQFRAAVANQFLGFIRDALSQGEVAHQSLLQMREQA